MNTDQPQVVPSPGALIGLVIPFQGLLGSYYFEQIMLGITDKLAPVGAHVVFYDHGEDFRSHALPGPKGGVSAWIAVAAPSRHDLVQRLAATHLPVVLIGADSEDPAVGFVRVDDAQGIGAAVDHLVEFGHREIGFLRGPHDVPDAQRREAGFRAALGRHGLPAREEWMVGGRYGTEEAFLAVRSILKGERRPTAFVAANDLMAMGVIEAARYLGLRVPEDLSVVGFDDLPAAAQMLPPLTTVHQPMRTLGRIAGEHVLDRVRLGPGCAPLRLVLEVDLALGGTTAPVILGA